MNFSYYLLGYRRFSVCISCVPCLLELCRLHKLAYGDLTPLPEGGVTVVLRLREARALCRLCGEAGVPLEETGSGGLPLWLGRFGRRPGLVAGFLVGALLWLAATGVVWDIRVSGNETVPEGDILRDLAACGLTVGTPLWGFRADVTENRVLLHDDRLAWVSVNRRGTVAYVEVREASHPPAREEDASPANLVAARGGIIQRVEHRRGLVLVTAGQTVGEGDLLVSGLYDTTRPGLRYTHASARVYARTVRDFSVEIPLSYEKKTYLLEKDGAEGGIFQEKMLNFFGRCVNFSKSTGNIVGSCDIIVREYAAGPVAGVGFPISVTTLWHLPYEMTAATRTYAEAEELAYLELSRYVASLPGDAELLSKAVTVTHGETSLTLTCRLTCIEDIASERPIEIAPPEP